MNGFCKIAFGGGCHWCTEAVFQSIKGVKDVQQGYVASLAENDSFSEAVVVTYAPSVISLKELVLIHLFTHESTADHSFRQKYRSAIYTMEPNDGDVLAGIWQELQLEFTARLITEVLPFKAFKPSEGMFHNYYYSNPDKPFCKSYIDPKLTILRNKFSDNWRQKTLSLNRNP
tara:strand:+ start:168 stop:686 length:519 start_codon:yes stop_codon:yes gene_type:complete